MTPLGGLFIAVSSLGRFLLLCPHWTAFYCRVPTGQVFIAMFPLGCFLLMCSHRAGFYSEPCTHWVGFFLLLCPHWASFYCCVPIGLLFIAVFPLGWFLLPFSHRAGFYCCVLIGQIVIPILFPFGCVFLLSMYTLGRFLLCPYWAGFYSSS